jgi:hypothetical protein
LRHKAKICLNLRAQEFPVPKFFLLFFRLNDLTAIRDGNGGFDISFATPVNGTGNYDFRAGWIFF